MTADHAARVQAILDEHVASGRLAAPYFAEADIRAVLDELKHLRTWLDELGYDAPAVDSRLRRAAEQQPARDGGDH